MRDQTSWILTGALLLAGTSGCGDASPVDPNELPATRLVVSNRTTGAAFDGDDFFVRVDGGASRILELNGSTIFDGLAVGSHTIELSGVASQCSATGAERATVDVLEGVQREVRFDVVCVAPAELSGVRLLFAHALGDQPAVVGRKIVAMNADGRRRVELTNGTSNDYEPDVSADGRKIVFMRDVLGDPSWYSAEVYGMTAGESAATRIFGLAHGARLSPDGREILYLGGSGEWGGFIRVAAADGSADKLLIAPESGTEDIAPAWSADGKQIAFTRALMSGPQPVAFAIGVVDRDGTAVATRAGWSPSGPFGPVWSPDGRIAFTEVEGREKPRSIKVLQPDESVHTLIENARGMLVTDWSADGAYILINRHYAPYGSDLFLLRVADRALFRLTVDGRSGGAVFWPGGHSE
jgi:hypothetical protein